jgi:hypothetical protein
LLNAAAEAILAHLSHCADHTTGSDRQPKAEPETAIMPTAMEDYLFDLRAGDCLLFVDCLTHGSTKRQIPGVRRAVIFRYAPRWTTPPASQPWMTQLTDNQKALLATQL